MTREIVQMGIEAWHPAELAPGVHRFRLELDGAPEETSPCWSLTVIRGPGRGPVLLVTAGVHGDEFEGMEGIRAFVCELDHASLRGTVIALPVVHEAAFDTATRCSPLDGLNLARAFPGRSDGSPTQRIAHALRYRLLPQVDFYCDLHAAGIHYDIAPLAGYQLGSEAFNAKQRAACEAFEMPLIWATAYLPGRSLSAAREAGVPAIYVEYPGGGDCRPEDVEHCRTSLLRLCGSLGMIDAATAGEFGGIFVEDDSEESGHLQIHGIAEIDGFFRRRIGIWQPVRDGDLVGEILCPFGAVLQTLRADQTGRVIYLRKTCRVESGDSCFSVVAGA